MVLRSIYLDPKLDAELAARAGDEGTTKAELMRRFLVEGLSRPATMFAGYATPGPTDARSATPARAAPPTAAMLTPATPVATPSPATSHSRTAPAVKRKKVKVNAASP